MFVLAGRQPSMPSGRAAIRSASGVESAVTGASCREGGLVNTGAWIGKMLSRSNRC
jgi:hypothetical protein